MTTEAFTSTPIYTIAGTGPYTVAHAYQGEAELEVRLRAADGSESIVGLADYSLTPTAAAMGPSGDLYLDATFAATNAGKKLVIERDTRVEQGWAGILGEREAGLERQMDRTVQSVQDLAQKTGRALKLPFGTDPSVSPDIPAPEAAKALKWNATGTALINSLYDPDQAQADSAASAAAALASEAAAAASAAAALASETTIVNLVMQTRAAFIAADLTAKPDGYKVHILEDNSVVEKLTGATAIYDKLGWTPVAGPSGTAIKVFGATGDGVTNDAVPVSKAIITGGAIELGKGDYYLSTQQVIAEQGKMIKGAGKGKTRLILDCAGLAGLKFDEAQHCIVKDMTIQGNDVTAPLVQMGDGSGITYSNIFENVRFVGNSAGSRPLITDTAHVAVRGIEATAGQANYFHRFHNCDFDSLFSAFHADYNANAWQISNAKMQNVWRCFKGGFQEWNTSTVFWHASAGSGADYAIFAELIGKSAANQSQYNHFLGINLEPGVSLTKMWEMDANTRSNQFDGARQTTILGTDNGVNNEYHLRGGDRSMYASIFSMLIDTLKIGRAGGSGGVTLFGDGTTSFTGTLRKLLIFSGGTGETRHGEIYQQTGADFKVESKVAGAVRLVGASGIALEGDAVTNLKIKSLPTQITVGAAGAASALPANPTKYLLVTEEGGSTYAIPMFISV